MALTHSTASRQRASANAVAASVFATVLPVTLPESRISVVASFRSGLGSRAHSWARASAGRAAKKLSGLRWKWLKQASCRAQHDSLQNHV